METRESRVSNREFKGGRTNVEDNPRSGARITGLTEANIESFRSNIDDNPYLTYNEPESLISLSPGSLERIIVDCLHLKKVASRYVPHFLTQKMVKNVFASARIVSKNSKVELGAYVMS